MNGILKASMPKLLGQTVYANHEASIGNQLGVVSNVVWQPAYTSATGVKIPAGINAEFKIDARSHPNIARGLLMQPPAIHSNSVTVAFGWEKSHPKMDDDEFRASLGKYGADKQLIRRIVNQIVNYHETSFVSHGADPFAQKIGDNGEIVNPGFADIEYNQLSSTKAGSQVYWIEYSTDTVAMSADPQNPDPNPINQENEDIMLKAIALSLKIDVTNLTDEQISAKITEALNAQAEANKNLTTQLSAATGELTTVKETLTAAQASVTNLTTEKDSLTTKLKVHTDAAVTALEAKRGNVLRMYKVLHAEAGDESAMVKAIGTANAEMLTAFEADYQNQLDEKYPAFCSDCRSTNVSRNSTITEATELGKEGDEGKPKPGKTISNQEVMKNLTMGKGAASAAKLHQ
jgi:hypothetical protein